MPEWRRVEGRTRCQDCGEMVTVSWKLYVTPKDSTLCICESCVEARLEA
jgi:formylmethanofuran dehydrogenase subunit E